MILYACSDLLWDTRVKTTAESLGVGARPVRSVEMLHARLADSDVRGLIVDMETGALGLALIGAAAGRGVGSAPIRVVAFGPHVATEALQAAREAGAGRVLSRGAFSARLPQILIELSGGSPRADDGPG